MLAGDVLILMQRSRAEEAIRTYGTGWLASESR